MNIISTFYKHLHMVYERVDSIENSGNLLIFIEKSIIPYRYIENTWVCLDISQSSPRALSHNELLFTIEQYKYRSCEIYRCNFLHPGEYSPGSNIQQTYTLKDIIRNRDLEAIKIRLCKPNGEFETTLMHRAFPILYLYSWACNHTGYEKLNLFQKTQRGGKKYITNFQDCISDIIASPRSNIIFLELIAE